VHPEKFAFESQICKETPLFSLIIPIRNEANIIVTSLNVLRKSLKSEKYELIIFDDCSQDGTYNKLRDVIASFTNPDMLLMHSTFRVGKGASIKESIGRAMGEMVLIMDVDLSADLASIPKLLKDARDSGGLVIGQRSITDRFSQGVLRVMLSLGYNLLVRLLFQTGISDHQCGFKAMKTDVARKLMRNIESDGFVFDTELIVAARKSGLPVRQTRVKWTDNRPRKSNFKWIMTSITMIRDLLNVRKAYGG